MATRISSREFNQDTAGSKKAAEKGPVFITDRGRPAHVLLTYETYEELTGTHSVLDTLSRPTGVEDVDFDVPPSRETPPAGLGLMFVLDTNVVSELRKSARRKGKLRGRLLGGPRAVGPVVRFRHDGL